MERDFLPFNNISDEEIKKKVQIISESIFNPKKCILCRCNFAITVNLPRIFVQCGHSMCSLCTQQFINNNVLTCPFCNCQLNNISSVENLPVNQKIFSHLQNHGQKKKQKKISKQENLSKSFEKYIVKCQIHCNYMRNFICTFHQGMFCQKCLEEHEKSECQIFNLQNFQTEKNTNEIH